MKGDGMTVKFEDTATGVWLGSPDRVSGSVLAYELTDPIVIIY